MTRIETIFGGLLAIAILGVVAFVFFGKGSTGEFGARASQASQSKLMAGGEAKSPQTVCDCFEDAFDLGNRGGDSRDIGYQSGLRYCYERFGREGSAAFEAGFLAATDDEIGGRICRPGQFR